MNITVCGPVQYSIDVSSACKVYYVCLHEWGHSTYRMAERITEISDAVNEVLTEQKMDTLLISEWTRLSEMCELLKPFSIQTHKLQTNSQSISYIRLCAFSQHPSTAKCYRVPAAASQQLIGNSPIPVDSAGHDIGHSSQAFVERLFSVCGMLTVGRRNRMSKSLLMRTRLKVNYNELSYVFSSAETCWTVWLRKIGQKLRSLSWTKGLCGQTHRHTLKWF